MAAEEVVGNLVEAVSSTYNTKCELLNINFFTKINASSIDKEKRK